METSSFLRVFLCDVMGRDTCVMANQIPYFLFHFDDTLWGFDLGRLVCTTCRPRLGDCFNEEKAPVMLRLPDESVPVISLRRVLPVDKRVRSKGLECVVIVRGFCVEGEKRLLGLHSRAAYAIRELDDLTWGFGDGVSCGRSHVVVGSGVVDRRIVRIFDVDRLVQRIDREQSSWLDDAPEAAPAREAALPATVVTAGWV